MNDARTYYAMCEYTCTHPPVSWDELRRRFEAKTIHETRKVLYFRYREGRASGDPVSASGLARVAAELWPC